MSESGRQRGSALLIALVVAALAALIATALLERARQGLARSEALLATERSWQYASGMTWLAEKMLREALTEGADPTALGDDSWSAPFDVPGGMVQGQLQDQQARFNVNALAHPDRAMAAAAADVFRRLLDELELSPIIADELADWLDGAVMPRPGSAASDWYGRHRPPYRTAGVPMVSASELRWLRSVDGSAWQVLAPVVSALPDTQLRVNVNTAPPELLAAVISGLDIDQARRVEADGPYSELNRFVEHPLVAGVISPQERLLLTVRSHWYMAVARVVVDGTERNYFRLMGVGTAGYDGFRFFAQGVP